MQVGRHVARAVHGFDVEFSSHAVARRLGEVRFDDFLLEESESVTLADSSLKTSLMLRLFPCDFGGALATLTCVARSSACTTRTNACCFGDSGKEAGRNRGGPSGVDGMSPFGTADERLDNGMAEYCEARTSETR
jgi:hypothetical protein